MLLQDALNKFYSQMTGVRAPSTIRWYKDRLKSLGLFFENRTVASITLDDLRAWRLYLTEKKTRWENSLRPTVVGGLSAESLHCHVRGCKKFFSWLADEGLISNDVARRLELPYLPKRIKKGLSVANRDKIIKQASTSARDHAIVLILADTACRLAGVAGLRLRDLELENRRAVVREKGRGGFGKERWIYFTPNTARVIKMWLKVRPDCESESVFVSTYYPFKGLSPNAIYEMLERTAKRAGVENGWNPHNWRHGAIRGMLNRGMPLPVASQIAGHSSTAITGDIYGAFSEEMLQEEHDKYTWVGKKTAKKNSEVIENREV